MQKYLVGVIVMSATFLHYHTGQPGGSLVGAPRLKEVGCLPAYLAKYTLGVILVKGFLRREFS